MRRAWAGFASRAWRLAWRMRACDACTELQACQPVAGPLATDPVSEATVALQQLGYKPAEAAKMARDAATDGDDVAMVIRKALQSALR